LAYTVAYKDFLGASEVPVKWAFPDGVRYGLALSERANKIKVLSENRQAAKID